MQIKKIKAKIQSSKNPDIKELQQKQEFIEEEKRQCEQRYEKKRTDTDKLKNEYIHLRADMDRDELFTKELDEIRVEVDAEIQKLKDDNAALKAENLELEKKNAEQRKIHDKANDTNNN